MKDLYNSKLQLGVEDTPYNRYYFSTGTLFSPFEKKVYLERVAPSGRQDNYINAPEGVSRVRKGLYAFLMEESGAYKIMEDTFYEHEKCELNGIEFVNFFDPFLSIKKRSPYKEMLKVK